MKDNERIKQRVYDYVIRHKIFNDGNSPTYQQIKDNVYGIESKREVRPILDDLESDGKIVVATCGLKKPRYIKIVGAHWRPPDSWFPEWSI